MIKTFGLTHIAVGVRDVDRSSAFYRQRAAECREIAKTASDVATRDEWLRLANQWTYLALHSER